MHLIKLVFLTMCEKALIILLIYIITNLFSSNGREHALVAEDHESMMLWILAIQVCLRNLLKSLKLCAFIDLNEKNVSYVNATKRSSTTFFKTKYFYPVQIC